jgi:hypothetical protein
VHANSIGISSRAEQTQYRNASPAAGHENSSCMYMRMSFDGELLESTLKPAYKHDRSFTGVHTATGKVYRFLFAHNTRFGVARNFTVDFM